MIGLFSNIRILEKEPNKKGDLFGRLMGDFFLTLGYDNPRFSIHKSGREIDIEAEHRTEKRRVVAECKATSEKHGGDEINKFVGALDVEKRKHPELTITGYFISLSGFKETTIEQEKEAGGDRIILVNGVRVVQELIKGSIIAPPEKAMESAGRCVSTQLASLRPQGYELLAHEIGWIWVIYYTEYMLRTHFTLIHADGEIISPTIADEIVASDLSVGGTLHTLTYLAPISECSFSEQQLSEAKEKYFNYIAFECGEIQLEGLPADQDVGTRKLNLENLFVPLHIVPSVEHEVSDIQMPEGLEHLSKLSKQERKHIGQVLSEYPHLTILAAPGGGKSTLLKRLATAYAFPERKKLISDHLPDRKYLPLFIRCRQLGNMARSPIRDILENIPERAELSELKDAFLLMTNNALRHGEALLLIDGLDEISDEGDRVSFVNQLRIFLATYPSVSIVVTSREAGFRIVGGALVGHCKHYKLADFDNNDIKQLTVAWHKEVVGNRADVIIDAEKLAETICETDRVRRLAQNPLLLTTLLLVKRWVGQLPTRRSVLYGKAIEVLLMTWNVEGYEPLDPDEIIPQLAFVAFSMMRDGVQQISSKRLKETLTLARTQMPEVLGYAKLSVNEFIERVELRSSLLMLSGHEVEDGTLYPMYEFRHLTFQEYLTAMAIVEEYYPDRKESDTLLSVLEPYLKDQSWKEVVPLATVLSGRKAEPLIHHLINHIKELPTDRRYEPNKVDIVSLLGQCILDEIQIRPDLLAEALEWIARRDHGPSPLIRLLFKGRHGKLFYEIVKSAYMSSDKDLLSLGSSLADITLEQIGYREKTDYSPRLVDQLFLLLNDENLLQKVSGSLAIMDLAYYYNEPRNRKITTEDKDNFKKLGDALVPVLYSQDFHLHFAACWAFAWLGGTHTWTPAHKKEVLLRLLSLWKESNNPEVQYVAAWALSALPIIDRNLKPLPAPDYQVVEFVKGHFSLDDGIRWNIAKRKTSLIAGFYWGVPWTDEELAEMVAVNYDKFNRAWCIPFLKALGEPGTNKLEELKQKEASNIKQKPKEKGAGSMRVKRG